MKLHHVMRIKREELGYSQEWVALQLGISQQAYGNIENGKTKLNAEMAERIAHLLHMPFADIYQPDGLPSTNEQVLRKENEMLKLLLTEKEREIQDKDKMIDFLMAQQKQERRRR